MYVDGYSPYTGEKASAYVIKREKTAKWKIEQDIIESLLAVGRGTVLDIPVGTGRFSEVCRKAGRHLIGMDVSRDMMSQAKGVECRYGSVTNIPLEDKAVETAICVRLLNWLTDDAVEKALSELHRVASEVIITLGANKTVPHRDRYQVTEKYSVFRL